MAKNKEERIAVEDKVISVIRARAEEEGCALDSHRRAPRAAQVRPARGLYEQGTVFSFKPKVPTI